MCDVGCVSAVWRNIWMLSIGFRSTGLNLRGKDSGDILLIEVYHEMSEGGIRLV